MHARALIIAVALAASAITSTVAAQTRVDPVGCYDVRVGDWTPAVGSQGDLPARLQLARGVAGENLVSPTHANRDASALWRELTGDSIYVLWKTTRWGGPAMRVRVYADSLTGLTDLVSDGGGRVKPHAPVFARRVACETVTGARTTLARDAEAMIRSTVTSLEKSRRGDSTLRVAIDPAIASTGRVGATTLADVAAIDLRSVASQMGHASRTLAEAMICAAGACRPNDADLLISVGVGAMTSESGVVWTTETWVDAQRKRGMRKCENAMQKKEGAWVVAGAPVCR